MKNRLISAIVALIIFIPLIILGGIYFKIGLTALSFFAIKEILDAKSGIPNSLKIITYTLTILLVFFNMNTTIRIYIILLTYFSLLILYEKEKYNIEICSYLCIFVVLITVLFNSIYSIRSIDIYTLFYLLLISTLTDTASFFGGKLFGKRKLIPRISPNKTVEGALIGTFFGTLIPSIFYLFLILPGGDIFSIILLTLILSIAGQVGDLIFSTIKRYYKIKDFSNIMPGHGGVLDRLDSFIFISISYIVLINFI